MLTKLRNSIFIKNVIVVMSGTAMAQIFGFACSPIISRLYTPSDFGVFGSFYSVCAIIGAGITLEYTQAILLQKEKDDALSLFILSCLCTLSLSFLLLIFCLFAPEAVHGVMKTSGVWVLALLIVASIATGFETSCLALATWSKAFKHTSTSQVIRSLSSNGMQVGFGYAKFGGAGLIVSSVLADILASLNLFRVFLPDLIHFRKRFRWNRIKCLAKEYRDFPMYAATQNIVANLSSGLPVLLLTYFFGVAVAGSYAFGMRILQVPMGLVLRAVRQVLLQKAGETMYSGNKLAPLYVKTTAGLIAVAFFPALVLFMWAPQIFTWVFGNQWQAAGEFARSLVLWLFVGFCNVPAVKFAQVIRIQRSVLFFDLVVLSARTVVLILGGLYLSALQTIWLLSIVGATMNAILIFFVGFVVFKKEGYTNLGCIIDLLRAR